MTCPIAGYPIDEHGARWTAGFVVLASLLALALPPLASGLLFALLALDFGVRAASRPRWSVLGGLSGRLLRNLGISPRQVDAGPKRFAARVGLLFTLALAMLSLADAGSIRLAVAGVLLACALLESLAGFCVGCRLWSAWYLLRDRLSSRPGTEPRP